MEYNYNSPLNGRYASNDMKRLFSEETKFSTWRKLWIALAKAEQKLGLNITDEQISDLIKHKDDLNIPVALKYEKEVKHDVMSHILAYGDQATVAKPIIHLGATSCYVGDNTDIIIMREALELLKTRIISIMNELYKFADKYKELPTLGFTHFQAAQLTTVGKRATLWLQDLLIDYDEICHVIDSLKLLGCKGTTGTGASFLELFEGDVDKVFELDKLICKEMGFEKSYSVSGQTYSRKIDAIVLNILSNIAQSASKFACDIRLLQHLKEVEEPFAKSQIGSSAMPYKRNPMRSERINSLARFVLVNSENPKHTAANQWFERTLDDSANKRLAVAECFLATDAILLIYQNVTSGLVVYENMIKKHIDEELPFMASENIMMNAVKKGGNRQDIHELIRTHSMEAGRDVKEKGLKNSLIERIENDPQIPLDKEELMKSLDAKNYIGASKYQVIEFLKEVKVVLDANKDKILDNQELNV